MGNLLHVSHTSIKLLKKKNPTLSWSRLCQTHMKISDLTSHKTIDKAKLRKSGCDLSLSAGPKKVCPEKGILNDTVKRNPKIEDNSGLGMTE